MIRRLLISYVSLTLVVVAMLEVPLGVTFARAERRHLVDTVRHDALSLALLSDERLEGGNGDLNAIVARYRRTAGGRALVVNTAGAVLADSGPNVERSTQYGDRPEIAAALAGKEATGSRHSQTLRQDLLYVAVPVASGSTIHGAVRITYPLSFVENRVRHTWILLAAIGVGVLAVVALASVGLARSVALPLSRLKDVAVQLGGGDLAVRAAEPTGPPEVTVLAHELNHAAAQLEQLVASQQAFLADASHELRTPLAALQLKLENLEAEASDGRQAADVREAAAEVERLARLTDGLLALARAEADITPRADVDVRTVLEERRSAWANRAAARGVRLTVSGDDHAVASVTQGHVEQIVDNLLSNAIDVAPSGTGIDLTAMREGAWIALHVIDKGPGLTVEEREHAFERFWRAPGDRGRRGSGLGLAITRTLVTSDDGEVELTENSDGGIDAVVRLPAASERRVSPPTKR